MMSDKKKQYILWFVAMIPLVITLVFFERLPDKIPMHWNTAGEVDRVSDKLPGAFILPGITLAIPLMMTLLPKIDPKRRNYSAFKTAYYWLHLCFAVVFGCISIYVLLVSLGYNVVRVDTAIKFLIGVMITVFGNLMPKLKHNYFVGIKTPWTLANENVWFETHRLAGRLWFAAGLIMILLSFIPGQLTAVLYLACAVFSGAIPMVYSYVRYKKYSS